MSSNAAWSDGSWHELIGQGANDRPCIKDDSSIWITFADLSRAASELGSSLREEGPGLVFIFASNDVPTVLGLFAAWWARMPVALLDPNLAAEQVEKLIGAYRPDVVLGRDFAEGNPLYRTVSIQHTLGVSSVALARAPRNEPINPDLGLLLSTSGSTGSPKFVRLARSAVVANARQIATALSIGPDDVGIGHLPVHYSYGLSVLTSHLCAGASVSLTKAQVTDPRLWKRIAEDHGTHFPGVPFHYTVLDRLGIKRMVPASVLAFTQAGGNLDLATRQRCHQAISERGGRFYVMYGQTEAGPRITTLQSEDFPSHSATVGQALEGGSLSIVDDNGVPHPPNVDGNVIYQGPNVMMGYATEREHLALADTLDGRLETGDRGVLSEYGFLTLTGRTQRFAKIAGLRIALDEIEAAVGSSGSVAAVAPNDKIILYVDKSVVGDVQANVVQLAQRLRLPSTVFVTRTVDAIPLKPSGKVDYLKLERFE